MDSIALAQTLAPVVDIGFAAFAKLFSRFHWVSILSALLIASACWAYLARQDPAIARRGLLGYLFPRRIWLHRSALLDYRFVLVDKVGLALLLGFAAMLFAPGAGEALNRAGERVGTGQSASLSIVMAYTAALLLAEDFFRYWAHRLMHASPFLWQFHKVHHSPEVLVPLSQMRTHPVNGLVNGLRSLIAIPLVTGAFLLLFPGQLTVMTILGVNAGRFVFDVLGSHLRHSHVWLSFGPVLSRIVISPAQHQVHHSRARRHWNRNYGSQFALWDWMFGTLYVPQRRERMAFGISRRDMARMRTVRDLYLVPFADAAAIARGWWRGRRGDQRGNQPRRLVGVRAGT
jgi:sterol desaturase/sphingolipid hydroxylase (fatty acid hydroxylase superfamily)